MKAKTSTGLEELSDEELGARRERLAFDVRSDPQLREQLEEAEAEIARRAVAGGREEAARKERRRREVRSMSDAQLEHQRTELMRLSDSEADAEGRQDVLAEIRRREARRAEQATGEVPALRERVRSAASAWEEALAVLVAATTELGDAIVARSNIEQTAFGRLPRSFVYLDRIEGRAGAVLREALRPGAVGELGWSEYRKHRIDELV